MDAERESDRYLYFCLGVPVRSAAPRDHHPSDGCGGGGEEEALVAAAAKPREPVHPEEAAAAASPPQQQQVRIRWGVRPSPVAVGAAASAETTTPRKAQAPGAAASSGEPQSTPALGARRASAVRNPASGGGVAAAGERLPAVAERDSQSPLVAAYPDSGPRSPAPNFSGGGGGGSGIARRYLDDTDASTRRRAQFDEATSSRSWFCPNPAHHSRDGILTPKEVALAVVERDVTCALSRSASPQDVAEVESAALHALGQLEAFVEPPEISHRPELAPATAAKDARVQLRRAALLASAAGDRDVADAGVDGSSRLSAAAAAAAVAPAAGAPRWLVLHSLAQPLQASRQQAVERAAIERRNREELAVVRACLPYRRPPRAVDVALQAKAASADRGRAPELEALLVGRGSFLDRKNEPPEPESSPPRPQPVARVSRARDDDADSTDPSMAGV